MKKALLIVFAVIVVLVGGFYALNSYIYNEKQADAATDYKDATYIIDGQRVTLKDGSAETEAAPGSASKITTTYFGNEVKSDLDQDGREDVTFILTQTTGGSGTFYYVVSALNTNRGYVGGEALLLGDRIAPQTTEFKNGIIVVNYADRAPGEDFGTPPSVGKTISLKLDPASMQFGEVAENFEGEANPETMKLDMKEWTWVSGTDKNGNAITIKKPDVFKITFGEDRISIKTDCNSMSAAYKVDGSNITVNDIASTKMYCEGSQENEFASFLGNATAFKFTSRGELILEQKDGGQVTFR